MPSSRRNSRFLAACAKPRVWRRALLIGLPVGLLQVTLNQGDHWWRHEVDTLVVIKSILSPLLSCSIALISSVSAQTDNDSNLTSP